MINRAVFVLFEVRKLVLADVDHVGGCEEYRRETVRVVRIVRGVKSCVLLRSPLCFAVAKILERRDAKTQRHSPEIYPAGVRSIVPISSK